MLLVQGNQPYCLTEILFRVEVAAWFFNLEKYSDETRQTLTQSWVKRLCNLANNILPIIFNDFKFLLPMLQIIPRTKDKALILSAKFSKRQFNFIKFKIDSIRLKY